jgi:hypothetical protein
MPLVRETAVLGLVMRNGPLAPLTLTVACDEATPPPPARLSRAVTWNVMVRVVVGSASPVAHVPNEQTMPGALDVPL